MCRDTSHAARISANNAPAVAHGVHVVPSSVLTLHVRHIQASQTCTRRKSWLTESRPPEPPPQTSAHLQHHPMCTLASHWTLVAATSFAAQTLQSCRCARTPKPANEVNNAHNQAVATIVKASATHHFACSTAGLRYKSCRKLAVRLQVLPAAATFAQTLMPALHSRRRLCRQRHRLGVFFEARVRATAAEARSHDNALPERGRKMSWLSSLTGSKKTSEA